MWSDKISTQTILALRDLFNIDTFVETGTWKGVNAEFYSHYFNKVLTCEFDDNVYNIAKNRANNYNVEIYNQDSESFLMQFKEDYLRLNRKDIIFFYLDAHFYKSGCTFENRWIVRNELRTLKDFKNCIICIHDFDCENLGHLCYDNEHLDFNIIKEDIKNVNSDFIYYTNKREFCDIVDINTVKELPIKFNDELIDYVNFINSSDVKRYRGLFYAIPKEIDLNNIKLKRFEENGT